MGELGENIEHGLRDAMGFSDEEERRRRKKAEQPAGSGAESVSERAGRVERAKKEHEAWINLGKKKEEPKNE